MRKILATLLLALFLPSIAHAQAPVTQQNRAALTAAINHSFPTNSQGFITATVLRGFLDNFLASITAIYQDTNIIPNLALAQVPGLTVKGNIGTATNNIADVPLASFFGSAPAGSIPLIALAGGGGGPDFTVAVDGFIPANAYQTMAVTSASSNISIAASEAHVGVSSVIIYNTGANAAFIKLSGGSPVADLTNDVIQPASWIWFTLSSPSIDHIAAITVTGSTSLNLSFGAGMPTGSGGGSTSGGGGGGGLSVVDGSSFTASVSAFTPSGGTYNASIPALANGQQGTFALTPNRSLHVIDDNSATLLTAVTSGIPTGVNSIGTVGLNSGTNVIGHIICDSGCAAGSGVIAAGTNIIGKVGIDQTTPGTTNAVALTGALPAGTNVLGHVINDAGTAVIGHVIADTGSTTAVTALPALAAGTNVIGHVIADTGSTTAVTALPAIPTGSNTIGAVTSVSQYPVGATPISASNTGTTAATTATLAGVSSHTTYICGLSIRANATAAITANSTVTGTITGTLNFTQWTAPNASGLGINEQVFTPCVPASATNTGIAVISAAPGTGGVVSVSAWGYQL